MEIKSKKVNMVYQYLLRIIFSSETAIDSRLPTEEHLNKKFNISRPTISKALSILEEEGYIRREQGIGTFVKDKSKLEYKSLEKKSIGLLLPLFGKGEIFEPITKEIMNLTEKYNFDLIWGGQFNYSESVAIQMNRMIDFYLSSNVSGLIMAPIELYEECFEINKKTIEKVKKNNIPTVLVDADYLVFPERGIFDLVGIDNFWVGYVLTKHYIQQGAKRVDYFAPAYSAQTVENRIRGYKQALFDANISFSNSWIHNGDKNDLTFITSMINKGANNFVCSNDSVAFSLIRAAEQLKFKIPEDFRVAGVDDLDFAQYLNISLTTVAQPCEEIAQVVIETLLLRMANSMLPIRTVELHGELKVRKSSLIS